MACGRCEGMELTITPHHAKYYAHDLTRRAGTGMDWLSMALFDAAAGLNPHQIDASLFAIQSPLSKCVVLADEVGLRKTTEAGIVLGHFWAERERRFLVICPASIRKQWALELEEKFNLPQQVVDTKAYSHAGRRGRMPLGSHIGRCHVTPLCKPAARGTQDECLGSRRHRRSSTSCVTRTVRVTRWVTGIRWVTEDCRKRLLTATRLQNSLLKLYGLSTLIDGRLFGDVSSFRSQYASEGGNLEGLAAATFSLCASLPYATT